MAINSSPNSKLLVGYFTVSAIHAEHYQVSDIPVGKLTHLNYACAGVSTSGECISINPQDDQVNFPALPTSSAPNCGDRIGDRDIS
jgi:GH18 family chitinase